MCCVSIWDQPQETEPNGDEMRWEAEARLGKQALCNARHAAGFVVGKEDRVHTPISRDESYTASMRTSLNELEHTHASTRPHIHRLKLIIGDVEQKQQIYDSSVSNFEFAAQPNVLGSKVSKIHTHIHWQNIWCRNNFQQFSHFLLVNFTHN